MDTKLARWFDRASRFAAALAGRIAHLEGRVYPGCGFHYDLVARLAGVRERMAAGLDQPYAFMLSVPLELLAEDVAHAEYFADHPDDESWADDPRPNVSYSCCKSRRKRRKMLAKFRAKHPHRKAVRVERRYRS